MALEIKELVVKIEKKQVLNGIDLCLKKGEIVVLMGPNGSGKSSLAMTLMGNESYEVNGGKILLDGKSLLDMSVDERAREGLFLSFQNPSAIEGVRVGEIMLSVIRKKEDKKKNVSALDVKKKVEEIILRLEMDKELLKRGINDGFSGGERKKMEMVQMGMLEPKYVILDEIDSGLDMDALKKVVLEIKRMVKRGVGVLVITHYRGIMKHLKPDRILVLKKGKIVDEGGMEVLLKLEKRGYGK